LDEAAELASSGGDVGQNARREVQDLLIAMRLPIKAAEQSFAAERSDGSHAGQDVATQPNLEPVCMKTEDGSDEERLAPELPS
jgi:hypothetical protein